MKIATVTKTLCDNPIYFFKRYAINRCFYLMRDRIWFEILDLYAMKQYMRLSGVRLTDFVCIHFWASMYKTYLIVSKFVMKNLFHLQQLGFVRQDLVLCVY